MIGWMEHQLQERFERERGLLTEVIRQSNRSTESAVSQFLSGLSHTTFYAAKSFLCHSSQLGRGKAIEDDSETHFLNFDMKIFVLNCTFSSSYCTVYV